MNRHKRYILILACAAVILLLPAGADLLFVVRAVENVPFAEVVARQEREGALYGTAFNQNPFAYKLLLYEAGEPDVAVLGSSRVMQFRQEFFTAPMTNMGGAVHSLQEGRLLLERMLCIHPPKLLFMGVDFWWFHPTRPRMTDFAYHDLKGDQATFKKFTEPLAMMASGRLSPADYFGILVRGPVSNDVTGHVRIGLDAILHSDGFRPDGSYLYGSMIFLGESSDREFAKTLEGVRLGEGRFVHAERPDPAMVALLAEMVEMCRKAGVDLVLFLPPVAPAVADAMAEAGGFAYVDGLLREMEDMGVPVFDYRDVSGLGATECEFIDGFHPGDVAVQRMLLDMAAGLPGLAGLMDGERLRADVERFAGQVLTIYDPELCWNPEQDFLGLGCPKDGR